MDTITVCSGSNMKVRSWSLRSAEGRGRSLNSAWPGQVGYWTSRYGPTWFGITHTQVRKSYESIHVGD